MITLATLLEQAIERPLFTKSDAFQAHLVAGEGHAAVIVGPNASGKSLFFRVLTAAAHRSKVLAVTVSIRERTGAGTLEMAGLRRMFMFGDESEQSTGATSLSAATKAFNTAEAQAEEGKPTLVLLDEPEQGLSEDYAAAMGTWLAQKTNALVHPNALGVVLVSHSRALVRAFQQGLNHKPACVSMEDPLSLEQWLNSAKPKTVEELLALSTLGKERWRAVSRLLQS